MTPRRRYAIELTREADEQLRVYFDVEDDPRLVVRILAVGVKVRNRVRIGGEEVELR